MKKPKRNFLNRSKLSSMKKALQLLFGSMVDPATQTRGMFAQLPNDPLDTYPTRTRTLQSMKWVVMTLFLACSIIPVFSQTTNHNLEGLWVLKELEGNDTARVLSPAEIEISTKSYLHDFPLNSTSLKFTGNKFAMAHHVGGVMTGTFDVQKNMLTLHASSCPTCHGKDFIFIIRKQSSEKISLDIFDEDEGSTNYVRLTFERNTIANNVNQK